MVCYACGEWLRSPGYDWLGPYEARFQYRVGSVGVERGLLTREQLVRALMVQSMDDSAHRPHRRLGTVCVEAGYLSPDEVQEILDAQATTLGMLGLAA